MHQSLIVVLGTVLACASGTALAAPPGDGDVTMTVIPSGGDVVKTVVQNITVPAKADSVAKAPHKAGQDSEANQKTTQQLAEAAAEHQAGQTQQQVQQQTVPVEMAAADKPRVPAPAPPPPPPRPPGRP